MKKLLLLLTVLLAITISCNKIDTSKEVFNIMRPVEVTPYDPEYAKTVIQKIYVEEFTGHTCIFCPAGAQELKEIMNEDPTVIATAIHCTSLANPGGGAFTNNYKTPMGDVLCNDFNIKGLPKATINRMEIGTNQWGMAPTQWRNTIAGIDRNNVKAGIQLQCTVNEAQQEIEAKVDVTIIKELPNPVQICLILQQDSIISGQIDSNSQPINNYIHKHMLRTGFNGNYGTRLTSNGIVSAQYKYSTIFKLSYTNTFPYSHIPIVIKNCSIIAYLIDMETKEVLQVELSNL